MHVRQAAIDAIVSNGQSLVVDSQQTQDRRVDVVDTRGSRAIEWFVSPFITGAIGGTATNATST